MKHQLFPLATKIESLRTRASWEHVSCDRTTPHSRYPHSRCPPSRYPPSRYPPSRYHQYRVGVSNHMLSSTRPLLHLHTRPRRPQTPRPHPPQPRHRSPCSLRPHQIPRQLLLQGELRGETRGETGGSFMRILLLRPRETFVREEDRTIDRDG
jgi:hypothetical protein